MTVNTSFPCSFIKNEPMPLPAPIKPIMEMLKKTETPQLPDNKLYTPARKAGIQSGSSLRQFITHGQKRATASKLPSQELATTINNLQSLINNLSQEAETTQQRKKRQSSQTGLETVPGIRTEQRAQIQVVNAAEKNFKKLVASLES